jgi:hypothetical protein
VKDHVGRSAPNFGKKFNVAATALGKTELHVTIRLWPGFLLISLTVILLSINSYQRRNVWKIT